jgi:membrane protease YdiL (CAAX protease family)
MLKPVANFSTIGMLTTIDTRWPRSLWPFTTIIGAIAAVFLAVGAGYLKRYSLPLSAATGIYGCFIFLLVYLIAPAMPVPRALLGEFIGGRYKHLIVLALLACPYAAYAAGTADFRWPAVIRLVTIAAPVIILYSVFPVRDQAKFNWQDGLIAVWLVSIVLLHLFKGIWNVPANLDFMARLFMAALGALCWTYIRPVPDLGYLLDYDKKALLAAVRNFALFSAIAIPLGLLLGFTSWHPRWRGLVDFLLVYWEIFLFIAILEELFFRGFLQNLLQKSLRSWWRGQLIASCIFGLFHILHAPFPNWRYVVLASIAGWFYGSAYRSGGSLLSSAALHAMVDTVWRTLFTKS